MTPEQSTVLTYRAVAPQQSGAIVRFVSYPKRAGRAKRGWISTTTRFVTDTKQSGHDGRALYRRHALNNLSGVLLARLRWFYTAKGREMLTKAIEIRDKGTFIPAIAIKLIPDDEGQRYLLRRAGYAFGRPGVVLMNLNDCRAQNDPSDWGGRTWRVAHEFVERHWDKLANGDVVDVEFILGETCKPKVSERADRSA